jgi:putative DNA primase/helicase
MTGQETVNLLIAQRRAHGADLKLDHPTYYENTLNKAFSRTEQEALKAGAHSSDTFQADSTSTIADRPAIDAGVQDLSIITALSWRAIERANHPPRLFLFGEVPSRLEVSDDGTAKPKGLTLDLLRHETARAARWFKNCHNKRTGEKWQEDAKPPIDVIRDMLASPVIRLPHLVRLVETPVFGRSGSLLNTPGYHATDGLYYAAARALPVPPVPPAPTHAHVQEAKRRLLDEFLCDFPFVNDGSRAQALGCLLLPFVRELIDGPTPLHLIEKPTPRTGGTLLAAMLVLPAVGKSVIHLTEANDNDTWKKAITAVLRSSPISVCIDNIRRRLESSHLASAITATTWTDRVLGFSENISLPVRTAWLATGNNPSLSDEMQSRTVLVRLDARRDRPEDRGGFRHALPAWAMVHRGELIQAALVLCQAWIVAGRPPGLIVKGGFESWSAVIGGILTHAAVPGFLSKQNDDLIDPDTQAWVIFLRLWWDRYKAVPVGVSELFKIVDPYGEEPLDLGLGDGSERSQKVRLGHRLIERRDRQFSVEPAYRLQIVAGKLRSRAQLWQLKMVRQEASQVNVVNESECFSTHHNGGVGEK